jgi:hypothetical protein
MEDESRFAEIAKVDHQIIQNIKTKTNSSIVQSFQIYSYTKTTCFIKSWFGEFSLDENEIVLSLIYSLGLQHFELISTK